MRVMTDEETIGDRLIRIARAKPEFAQLTLRDLAGELGMTYETLRRWQTGRYGPTRRRADELAAILDTPVETLTHGVNYALDAPEDPDSIVEPVGSSQSLGIAQPVSQDSATLSPRPRLKTVNWRDDKMVQALKRFSVVAPDDSMAPVILRGTRVIFDKSLLPARNDDVVLLRDMAGDWHIREYQGTPDGKWHALPQKDRAPVFYSDQHGLEVLAVFDGTDGRRG